jgi:filamentous hemagglutinin
MHQGERVAQTKKMASLVVESQQWVKDRKLTKLNGRDVYDGKDGYLYALDTQHGRFERVNAKSGKHVEEVKMNMSPVEGTKDSSGGDDLRIK